jgi:hypothetical protein
MELKKNESYFMNLEEEMGLLIRDNLPEDYKLVIDFGDEGNCKLFQKDNSYICSSIVPWFDNKEIYIEIVVTKNQLAKRHEPPIGFSKNEFDVFAKLLLNLCESISHNLFDVDDSHLLKMQIEHISMPFWANSAIIYLMQHKEDEKFDLYYSLSQIIYACFGAAQDIVLKN